MLCLSRKTNEIVRIGDDVSVRVLYIRPGYVRLGFTAPPGVRIERDELRRRILAGEPLHEIEDDLDHQENLRT